MSGFVWRRLLALIPVLLCVGLLAFAALAASPGDTARVALMAKTGSETPPEEAVRELRLEMGLDLPLYRQYLLWLGRTLSGDLGRSIQTGRSVAEELRRAAPASLALALSAMVLTVALALPAGVVSARRRGRLFDRLALAGSLGLISLPDFFLGILLVLLFSLTLGLTPVAGGGDAAHLVLPALTLALSTSAVSSRMLRASMIEALSEKSILAARARGLSERAVAWKHALRGAAIPVLSYIGSQFGYFLGGAVVVESVFVWPGLGRLLVDAVRARDVFVVQGAVLCIATGYVLANLAADVLHAVLDPRVRHVRGNP